MGRPYEDGAFSPQPAAGVTVTIPANQAPEFQDPKALQDRLDRHGRKVLKDLGFESPEAAKAAREKLAAMEQAESERLKAEMTEAQRAMAEAETAKARAAKLEAELQEERRTNKINAVLHAKGIKNADYARFLLDRETAGAPDPDYEAAITKAMGDPMTRAALGIAEGTPQTPQVQQPANTSPAGDGLAPKPPTAGGAPEGPKSTKSMSAEEWTAWKRSNGLF